MVQNGSVLAEKRQFYWGKERAHNMSELRNRAFQQRLETLDTSPTSRHSVYHSSTIEIEAYWCWYGGNQSTFGWEKAFLLETRACRQHNDTTTQHSQHNTQSAQPQHALASKMHLQYDIYTPTLTPTLTHQHTGAPQHKVRTVGVCRNIHPPPLWKCPHTTTGLHNVTSGIWTSILYCKGRQE